jgi:hypothetical protein
MTREEIFDELKTAVLAFRDEGKRIREDAVFRASLLSKQQELGIEVKKLNSCDASWLNDEYGAWFKAEVLPNMPEIDPSVKDKLLWK